MKILFCSFTCNQSYWQRVIDIIPYITEESFNPFIIKNYLCLKPPLPFNPTSSITLSDIYVCIFLHSHSYKWYFSFISGTTYSIYHCLQNVIIVNKSTELFNPYRTSKLHSNCHKCCTCWTEYVYGVIISSTDSFINQLDIRSLTIILMK